MIIRMEDCPKFEGCSAPVCPFWEYLEETTVLKGEEWCPYMLDYCEGKKTPIDEKLRETEPVWKKILGKKLQRRLEDRKRLRAYWRNKRRLPLSDVESDIGLKEDNSKGKHVYSGKAITQRLLKRGKNR
jgi:hypothetical protein